MILSDSEKSKRSTKGRYLSPSFKKGLVTEKPEEDEFKLNLVSTGEDGDRSSSPSPKKIPHKNSEDLKINLMKSDELEFN